MSELLLPYAELLPPQCFDCRETPSRSQQYYFRSFTEASYRGFIENPYRATPFEVLRYKDSLVVPRASFDHPGTFWMTTDPLYSYSLGLARGITEDIPIRFMVMNYCTHQEEEGITPYAIQGIHPHLNVYFVKPLNSHSESEMAATPYGSVFPSLSPDQIEKAKWFTIPEELRFRERQKRVLSSHSNSHVSTESVFRDIYQDLERRAVKDPYIFLQTMHMGGDLQMFTA